MDAGESLWVLLEMTRFVFSMRIIMRTFQNDHESAAAISAALRDLRTKSTHLTGWMGAGQKSR